MSQNSTPSYLDNGQIIKRIYEESDDAVRVKVASGTEFAVSLSSSEDSISSQGQSGSTKASLTNASTGVVVAAESCAGYKSFQLYTKTTSALVGPQTCTLEVSPSDTDDVWIATALTVSPSTSNNAVVMGTANSSIVARRCRVSIAAAITSGTFDIYLVKQGV